jgi:hypothetical protein
MMQWQRDLENLVEQTRAMVRHANPKGIEPAARSEMPSLPEPAPAKSSPPPNSSPPHKPSLLHDWAMPELTFDRPARDEIMQRVEDFRAHQEKLRREREDYYLEMTEKMRAMLRDDIQNKH